jgi:predicted O-linked N-acetylglucosamine transferase (SPINDLY family)
VNKAANPIEFMQACEESLAHALRLQNEGKTAEALLIYDELHRAGYEYPTKYLGYVATAKTMLGRASEAVDDLLDGYKKEPLNHHLLQCLCYAAIVSERKYLFGEFSRDIEAWNEIPQDLYFCIASWLATNDFKEVAQRLIKKHGEKFHGDSLNVILLAWSYDKSPGGVLKKIDILEKQLKKQYDTDIVLCLIDAYLEAFQIQKARFQVKTMERRGVDNKLIWRSRGIVELFAGRLSLAEKNLRMAAEHGGAPDIWTTLAECYFRKNEPAKLVAVLNQAEVEFPDCQFLLEARGRLLGQIKRPKAAVKALIAADNLGGGSSPSIAGQILINKLKLYDWNSFDEYVRRVQFGIENGEFAIPAFSMQLLSDDPKLILEVARGESQKLGGLVTAREFVRPSGRPEKINIGYFSPDFCKHPVSYLMAPVIKRHDLKKFNVYLFFYGPRKSDEITKDLKNGVTKLISLRNASDGVIVQKALELNLDVAIDLCGYTQFTQQKIFAQRVAPIQMSYLGYLGSSGSTYIDYLIADPVLIPSEHRADYTEKIIFLPSYQANADDRKVGQPTVGYAINESPRPFRFASLNNEFKLNERVFGLWVEILQAVDNSVLYILGDNADAVFNLRAQMKRAGLDPERLRLMPRAGLADYRANLQYLDLFLDTFPYGAGATGSEVLWSGVPLLTLQGRAFQSRMASSLVHAMGVSELIAKNDKEYVAKAIRIATDKNYYEKIKQHIKKGKAEGLLFNTSKFVGTLEKSFQLIVSDYYEGKAFEDKYIS